MGGVCRRTLPGRGPRHVRCLVVERKAQQIRSVLGSQQVNRPVIGGRDNALTIGAPPECVRLRAKQLRVLVQREMEISCRYGTLSGDILSVKIRASCPDGFALLGKIEVKAAAIAGDELRAVITDDPGRHAGMLLQCRLTDDFDIQFRHRLSQFVVHDVATVSVQNRDQVAALGVSKRRSAWPITAWIQLWIKVGWTCI